MLSVGEFVEKVVSEGLIYVLHSMMVGPRFLSVLMTISSSED